MNISELKLDLINQISHITEKVKLLELIEVLKFQSDESLYLVNPEESMAIAEAQSEILDGKFISNSDFQKEIKEWLNK